MKRRLSARLLGIAVACTALAGCGGSKDGLEKTGDAGTDGGSPDGEESYEVVLETVTLGEEYPDIPAIEEAINAITLPDINCTVSILPIGIADHANKMSMMISGGEKLDLCMSGLTTNLTSMASDGMLYSLDEYLDTTGKDLRDIFGVDLEAGIVDGKLYGIPANNANGKAGGYIYNKELADAADVEIPEKCTVDEFEGYYEKIKEKNPDLYLTTQGNGQTSGYDCVYQIDRFGDMYGSYGVIIDSLNQTTIENWYGTEEAREYYTRIKRWRDEGMIPADSLTSGVIGQDMFRAKQIFAMLTNVAPREKPSQSSSYEFEIGMTQLTDAYKNTDSIQEFMWAVPVTSERPEKAMEFLNLMYTNTEIGNLLSHGLEGKNYEKTEAEGIVNKIDAEAPGYARVFSIFGDQTKIAFAAPAEEGIQQKIKEFSENASCCKTLGYVFDNSKVAVQAAAVANAIQQYGPALETGMIEDVDAGLKQMVEVMDQAGMEEIIAENQAQLDAWLSSR